MLINKYKMILNNINVIYSGLHSTIMNSNIVVVNKKSDGIDKESLSSYLSKYSKSEIRKGKLIESGDYNKYELESGEPKLFNLIIFVCNSFDLSDKIEGDNFNALGYIEIPNLGIEGMDIDIVLKLKFNILENNEVTELNTDLSSVPKYSISDYIGERSTNKFTDKEYLNNLGVKLVPTNQSDIDTITYIPDHLLSNNKLYKIPRINLDISGLGTLLDTNYISFDDNEFVSLEFIDKYYFRNVSLDPSDSHINDLSVSGSYIIDKSPDIESYKLMPDFIAWKPIKQNWKYIKVEDYLSGGYSNLNLASTDTKTTSTTSGTVIGIDRVSNDVNLIISNNRYEKWFLQSRYTDFVTSNTYLSNTSYSYSVIEHNVNFYVIKEKTSIGITNLSIVDSLGNKVNNLSYYKLFIDGSCIIEVRGVKYYLESNIKTKDIISLKEDLYKYYPGLTSIIMEGDLDMSKIILVRDRIQLIN